ncbi:helix-turn-helix transcriptional regulator [Leucobacter chromiireducens]|uniref:helix-turn-helix transcriptional regulator n=1 Tax=Leucobacter chromiireducens TaxID=283877 RepID=UPI000F62C825|nr:helix-turn-helix transcriptional regulator [Leucobacter chromiireducens]
MQDSAAAARGAWRRERSTLVRRVANSPQAVPEPFAIIVQSQHTTTPLELEPHTHPQHELVWVRGGTMTVQFDDRVVTVPDGYGVWIPAGTVHSGRTTTRTRLCDAHFEPSRSAAGFDAATVVEVTPVLAALLTHLEGGELPQPARLRAEAVVFDVLAAAEQQFALQTPRVERVDPIVAALLADPTDARSLGEWAGLLGISERTITRAFRAHTGLSFLQWRQVLRVHHSLSLIADGHPVHEVSQLLGYAQPSTFIASFKRVLGVTPGSYQARQREPAQ